MSKSIDKGLHYFNLDCGIFSDKSELKPLLLRYHGDGLTLFIHILCDVYDSGYYFKPDSYEDYIYALAQSCGMSVEKVQLILAFMADRSLLDAYCLNKNTVFTSHGIQKRYCQAMKGRKRSVAEIKGEHWLLSEKDEAEITAFYARRRNYDKSEIKADKSEIKADKSESCATNKIKEDNKTIKESQERERAQGSPEKEIVLDYFKTRGYKSDGEKFYAYYSVRAWTLDGQPIRNWRALAALWEKRESDYIKSAETPQGIVYEKYTAEQLNSMLTIIAEDDET